MDAGESAVEAFDLPVGYDRYDKHATAYRAAVVLNAVIARTGHVQDTA